MGTEPVFADRRKNKPTVIEVASPKESVATTVKPRVASRMPVPSGYKILIALPEADEKTEGGIIKAEETKRIEEIGSVCGFVLAMGPDCYKDESRFPSGPYCKVGDWVMMRSYSGSRFAIDGREVRLINDDSVEAVVEDPRGITKR
jgi:co-chaperonin GroES (HSP10)